MFQYILNLTSIWLISLVVFDIFLRRESYHEYNRFYLLITFLAGIFLPLYQYSSHTAFAVASQPVKQVFAAKQYMQAAATQVSAEASINWLLIIWGGGMLIAAGVLIVDIIKLFTFFTNGKRSVHGNWTIVETHKEHAPFSFLNILFVSSGKLYDADEWDMLLVHERQHARLLHIADVVLVQLSRVVFWFHPLVYIYHNRLSLVHEYQADNASGQDPKVYGRFLVEQMMLQSAPSVAHALSNAPVKNRIQMLTHKSPRYRHPAKLMIFPLIALFVICFTRYDIDYQVAHNDLASRGYEMTVPAPYNFTASAPAQPPNSYSVEQQSRQVERTKSGGAMQQAIVYHTDKNVGFGYHDAVIQLAGMENNANAKCCSSNLLWGSDYAGIAPANCYPDKQPLFLSEYAGNSCTQGYDRGRKDQYTYAVEAYRHIQESWDEYTPDNSLALIGLAGSKPIQIIIADDPWSTRSDKSPGMVPPLSLDRSLFGPNTKTIYDDALAIAQRKEKGDALAAHDRFSMYNSSENRPAVRQIKSNATGIKPSAFTP